NTLYIATGSGIYSMNTHTEELTELKLQHSGTPLLEDNFANCIFQDSRGLIWLGGRKEVCIYNQQKDSVVHLSTNDGLSHTGIRAITEDHNHNIWISTDHGITHVTVGKTSGNNYNFVCYPYYNEDGIGNYTLNNFSIFCNKKGNILIGGTGGYLEIDPTTISANAPNHRVVFTELYLNESRVEVDKAESNGRILLKKNMQQTDAIHLKYSDNHFSIEVSTMEYGELHKQQYVYRLSKNSNWLKLDGNRIHFNKLTPGTYLLEVKVKERSPSGNNPISTLNIHIAPPYWLSIPAYILYAVGLILLAVLYAVRLKQKHQRILKQQKRELEITQRQEMDEAKLRFYTNISHDLRTPLTLIISPLEKLLQTGSIIPELIKDELELMHRNSLLLLDVV
ncbi:MAG: two-component regulator propeller domain-containing protein, partial [Parabacteroides sp.]|nr:two-component regulator propeller domain-containing protein [Parabacteroides sp.]